MYVQDYAHWRSQKQRDYEREYSKWLTGDRLRLAPRKPDLSVAAYEDEQPKFRWIH